MKWGLICIHCSCNNVFGFVFAPVKPAVYAAAVILACSPTMRAAKVTTVCDFPHVLLVICFLFYFLYKYKEKPVIEEGQRGKYEIKASSIEELKVKKLTEGYKGVILDNNALFLLEYSVYEIRNICNIAIYNYRKAQKYKRSSGNLHHERAVLMICFYR